MFPLARLRLIWTGSISRQLILGVCAALALAITAFVWHSIERQREFLDQQSREHSMGLARALAANSTQWVLANDLAGLAEVVNSVSSYPDLRYAMVFSRDGRVLAHSNARLTGQYLSDDPSLKLLRGPAEAREVANTLRLIDVAAPITSSNGVCIGWVRVGLGTERTAEALRDMENEGICFAVIASLAALLAATAVLRGLTRGLNRLVTVTRGVAAGEAGARSGMKREDELGALSAAFDAMAEALEENGRKLRASEDELRRLLAHLPAGVLIRMPDGSVRYANDAARDTLGIIPSDTESEGGFCPRWRFVREDGSEYPPGEVPSMIAMKSGKPVRGQTLGVARPDGKLRWLYVHAFPELDAEGNPRHVIVSFLDLTERMQTEELLHRRAEEFLALVENAPDPVMRFDTSGKLIYVNPAVSRVSGNPASRLLENRHGLALLAGGPAAENIVARVKQAAESGATTDGPMQIVGSAGYRQYYHNRFVPERGRNGQVASVLSISVNVTSLVEAERQFRTLVENLPDYIARLDEKGRFTYVSPAIMPAFGAPASSFIGKFAGDIIRAVDLDAREVLAGRIREVLTSGKSLSAEARLLMPADERTMEIRYVPEPDETGKVASVLCICRDITERIRLTQSLRELSAAVEQSPVSVLITDTDGRITYVNPAFCTHSRYTPAEVLGETHRILDDDALSEEEYAELWSKLKAGETWHGTFHHRRKDGSRHWEETDIAPIRDGKGNIAQFVCIQQDITARKMAEEKAEYIAHHDALTGLPNRLLGRDRMEMAMKFAGRHGCKAALVFLDLDGFKRINDSLGHETGDGLLRSVAARLQLCVRKSDTIARQGGDEFLMILPEIRGPEDIATVAKATLEQLSATFPVNGYDLTVTASIGIAVYPDDGEDWEALVKNADVAMYCAKEAGRNTFRYYTREMNAGAGEYLCLRNKLHHALERREFTLHYQPQIDLKTGKILCVEALIRWFNPDLGHVPPSTFIPLAEDTGLIVPIGEWVLREACGQAAQWHRAGLPKLAVAVNMSAVQFKRSDVLAAVRSALEETQLDPSCLELEMTESILLKETENVLKTVWRLKAMGVKLSIDDFGTGYSSLSYLKRFCADKVKIDKSFIRDLATDNNSNIIVHAIVQMAKSLGISTIAEGVEDEQALDVLRRHECDEVQGFYYAQPMPAAELCKFLGKLPAGARPH